MAIRSAGWLGIYSCPDVYEYLDVFIKVQLSLTHIFEDASNEMWILYVESVHAQILQNTRILCTIIGKNYSSRVISQWEKYVWWSQNIEIHHNNFMTIHS